MKEPVLLTPGPLTTSSATKLAMVRDWGSRDSGFIEINRRVREMLLEIAGVKQTHVSVPLQGSGTFVVEAMLGTMVPKDGHVLVPQNGAYCKRIAKICSILGRRITTIEFEEREIVKAASIDAALAKDPSITHVALVHCETSTGVLNPLAEVAAVVARHGKSLLVDAMSSFAAVEIKGPFDALVAASGKCLEGPPGMGFALVRKSALEKCAGNSPSLVLDLHDQWVNMEKTAQWRFTPPTVVVAALHAALEQFVAEGGQPARGGRYKRNCEVLIEGMTKLGFKLFLEPRHQAPVIVTFHAPTDPNYDFQKFYDRVREKGFVLYPGKLTQIDTLRVGCIGAIDEHVIRAAVHAIADTVAEQNIRLHESGPVRPRQHAA
ncbi:MAG TPA: 2-aminoethylphosphonate--pyruvate transaminase [Burkholderiales bacterium]|nr:2-aminoethylphosphonate--pyruvate transaminase [Burkholderiales bacterium]